MSCCNYKFNDKLLDVIKYWLSIRKLIVQVLCYKNHLVASHKILYYVSILNEVASNMLFQLEYYKCFHCTFLKLRSIFLKENDYGIRRSFYVMQIISLINVQSWHIHLSRFTFLFDAKNAKANLQLVNGVCLTSTTFL